MMKALALEIIVGREASRRTRKYANVEDVDIKDNGKELALPSSSPIYGYGYGVSNKDDGWSGSICPCPS